MSVILHSDLNCFYASVEMNEQPQLKGKKVAVCGSTENRHGIVLTASYPAKRSGVKTGMANWQAKQACPGLIMVDPHYDLYLKYSRIVRRIYQRYSEIIEPFGMDENWIQLPFTNDVEGIGFRTAEEIRKTVESETGLTVSIGVSFSKIFAKLGSDMKKRPFVSAGLPAARRGWPRRRRPLRGGQGQDDRQGRPEDQQLREHGLSGHRVRSQVRNCHAGRRRDPRRR